MNIEQIALEVQHSMSDFPIAMLTEEFYAEFLRRCLAKIEEGLEPTLEFVQSRQGNYVEMRWHPKYFAELGHKLYLTPVEAILADEQDKVVEACARSVISDGNTLKLSNATPKNLAIAIATNLRAGSWKGYL